MATTTNYGWTTPDDTSLVKDGAAAIRTLGSSVDTTTKALNPSTTLGDIEYRSATANTNTRLGIGSSGNVLTVAGGVPTWAAPGGGGGMTVLASGSLPTGTGVFTLSSISTSYLDLQLVLRDIQLTSTASCLQTLNNDTGANYNPTFVGGNSSSVENVYNATSVNINYNSNIKTGSNKNTLVQTFYDYTNTTSRKVWNSVFGYQNSFGSEVCESFFASYSGANAAITRIDMTFGSNITAGTYILYGVK
jgi:hypothetical protein